MDKVSILKMTKQVKSKLELAKAIIEVTICFKKKKLSATQITVLAYFMVYGVSSQTKTLIIKSGVCKNIETIKMAMVTLKKQELIYKDDFDGRVKVTKALNVQLGKTVALYFKIDNN